MPGGDRTGPWGAGPMTGRGAGFCAGYAVPGAMNPVGRGYGLGRGWGGGGRWGYRHWYHATGLPGWVRAGYGPAFGPAPAAPTIEQDATYLENQAAWLRGELETLEGRLAELRGQGESGKDRGG